MSDSRIDDPRTGYPLTPIPDSEREWAETYRDVGYDWCRPCRMWHRPPECPIDETGAPAPYWEDEEDS